MRDVVLNNNPECTGFDALRKEIESKSNKNIEDPRSPAYLLRYVIPPWEMRLGDEKTISAWKCMPVKVVISTSLGNVTFNMD